MDAEHLFGKKKKKTEPGSGKKIIFVPETIYGEAMVYPFQSGLCENPFEIRFADAVRCGQAVIDGEVDLALISALDYASNKQSLKIVPGVSVTATAATGLQRLLFKKNLQQFKNVSLPAGWTQEATILKIIMQEKYAMTPDYRVRKQQKEIDFSTHDAALLCNEDSLRQSYTDKSFFELEEEWLDMCGMPLVQYFWAGREAFVGSKEIDLLKTAALLARNHPEKIAGQRSEKTGIHWSIYHDILTKASHFGFGEREEDALTEFYHFAFFFGYSPFIPELNFF